MAKSAPAVEEAAALRRQLLRLVEAATAEGAGADAFDEAAAALAALREVEVGGRMGGGGGEGRRSAEEVFVPGELLCSISSNVAAVVEPWSALEADAGVGVVADSSEIQVPFSQVHRVVSDAIGSRFWRLQEGDSSDDEKIILAEVADEPKAENRRVTLPNNVPKFSQGKGVQSSISSCFRRSLQVRGQGSAGQGSSSKLPSNLLFDEAIAAGYSPSELRSVGVTTGRSNQTDGVGRPWPGQTVASLPVFRSNHTASRGLPWMRKVFQSVWNRNRPNPKKLGGGWSGTLTGDRRLFAEVVRQRSSMDFGRGCAGGPSINPNLHGNTKDACFSFNGSVSGQEAGIGGVFNRQGGVARLPSVGFRGSHCLDGGGSSLGYQVDGVGRQGGEPGLKKLATRGSDSQVDNGLSSANNGGGFPSAIEGDVVSQAGFGEAIGGQEVGRSFRAPSQRQFKERVVNDPKAVKVALAASPESRPTLIQSARFKKQQSGDDDSIQKAMRKAKVRNLELDPNYLFDWALAEGLGKFAETRPEGVHAGWKRPSGGCGEANFMCSRVAI